MARLKEICENCTNYDITNSSDGTGYCLLWGQYVTDDDECEAFEEE